jgi:hypothetical protein
MKDWLKSVWEASSAGRRVPSMVLYLPPIRDACLAEDAVPTWT